MRLIGADGENVGVVGTDEAMAMAEEAGMDLVEIQPTAIPPVCRIMDFGKYIYEEQKKHAHSKPAGTKLKEIEFTVRIEKHDFETKVRHAEEFLDEGSKVKLRLKFRGREMAHTEMGFDVMNRALKELETMGHPDAAPKLTGKQINVMLTPNPVNKRKPKYHVRESAPAHPPAGAGDDHGAAAAPEA